MVRVTFQPGGESGGFERGSTVFAAAEDLRVPVNAPCGGHGRCGGCRVIVEGETSPPTSAELEHLSQADLQAGYRLACQVKLLGDAVVRVPVESQTTGTKIISEHSWREVPLEPNVHQRAVRLPKPTLEDQRSDLVRLAEALDAGGGQLEADPAVLRSLPAVLRAEEFAATVTTVGRRLARVLPRSQPAGCLGIGVDLGTTTVVVYLVDLLTGELLGTASALNPQTRWGHDVVSRIEHVSATEGGLDDLRAAIVEGANQLIAEAARKAGVAQGNIFEATVVGNTCMHHLFLGLDPTNLAQAPYVPVANRALEATPGEVGLAINRRGNVYCLPVVAGFVGSDTVAALAVTRLTSRDHPVMAIDIGTNGEVMLWSGDRLLVASCAAGPAFEGAQMEHGVRAAPGAIEHVWLRNGEMVIGTIDAASPTGICGSGIFDVVAALLDATAADETGRLAGTERAAQLPAGIAARLRGGNAEREFVVAPAEQAADGRDIVFTQKDLREVQLAKGAVRAAVELLCAEAGVEPEDLKEVLLAGAFGNYIDPRSALRIGLLPSLPAERIQGVGNAAGAGALLALVSAGERRAAAELAEQAEHIELFTRADFQMVFADSMIFPAALKDATSDG
jgi:uncharacterized 2Fe-2S/4Fe-4S cluster protein (DUF4445 family)